MKFRFLIGWCLVLGCWRDLPYVQSSTLWNVKTYIRMGITIFKIFIWGWGGAGWGCTLSVFWSQIAFTAPLTRHCTAKFLTIKPTIYLRQWPFWVQFPLNVLNTDVSKYPLIMKQEGQEALNRSPEYKGQNFINSLSWMLQATLRPKAATVSKKK